MKKSVENIDPVPVCQKLRALRESLGFTKMSRFAKKLGIKYTTYRNYEIKTMPPMEVLIKITEVFPHKADVVRLLSTSPTPYQPDPEHMLPRNGSELHIVDRKPDKHSNIDRHTPTIFHEGEITEHIDMVRAILTSDDTTTKEALKANIRVFADHIRSKEEMKEMKKEIQQLQKSIASSPNPGKNGTGEA